MFVKMIEKIDDHVIIYSALAGVVWLPFATILPGTEPLMIPFCTCFLGTFLWYSIKSVVVTSQTVIRMKAAGEPIFQAGGLTEYDSEFARQVGEAAGKASKRDKCD